MTESHKLAKELKKIRKSQWLSQKSLAELVGVKHMCLSKWELGLTNPWIDVATNVIKTLSKQTEFTMHAKDGEITYSSWL